MRRGASLVLLLLVAALVPAAGGRAAFPSHRGELIAQVTLDCSVHRAHGDCPSTFVEGVRFLRPGHRTTNHLRCTGCLFTSASWSRDGRALLVNSRRGVEITTGGALRLVPGTLGADGAWGARGEIVLDRRGGRLTRVSRGGRVLGSSGTFPDLVSFAVSARGEIAFEAERLTPTPVNTIWVARADGTHARRVARGTNPSFSPDGARILFSRSARGGYEVWTVARNGGRARRLVRAPSEVGATWSPHGTRVAFARCARGGCEIRTVSARGGASRRFARGAESSFPLSWRP